MNQFLLSASLLLSLAVLPARAQGQNTAPSETPAAEASQADQEFEALGWVRQGKGDLTKWAELEIPAGFRFTNATGAKKLLQLTGNVPDDTAQGVAAPEDFSWWVLFRFQEEGYVKDDEKDQLNAPKLLKQMQEGQKASNEYRKEQGLGTLEITGWAQEPAYNTQTNNLEWGLNLRNEKGGENVNFETKLLGRHGYMEAVLVCDQEQLPTVLPEFQKLLQGYHYKSGESYAEYKEGDKVAEYGLTALVLGGGAAIAAKTGLLAALWKFIAKGGKFIIFAVVAVAAVIGRFFKRLFGRGE